MFIQFATDATSVGIAYTLVPNCESGATLTKWYNFRPTGFSGADLYAWDETAKEWGFLSTTMGGLSYPNSSLLVEGIPAPQPAGALRIYRAHLPMYGAISSVSVLASGGQVIQPDWSFLDGGKPVVWYGTSITQGGVSPRPGHAYTNRIARMINREVLNYGFCGSGTMELSVAKYLSTLDASVFVIDCDWNMDAATIAARAVPYVQYLRAHGHPTTPVILAEGSDWPAIWISNAPLGAGVAAKRAAMEAAFAQLKAAGDKNIHLVQGHMLYGNDTASASTATFNNVHPTDLGHWKISQFYASYLPTIISSRSSSSRRGSASKSGMPPGVVGTVSIRQNTSAQISAPAPTAPAPPPLAWTDFSNLEISGRAFNDTPSIYNRLPAAAKSTVRGAVWDLSLDSAGLSVRFETNAPEIYINYTLLDKPGVSWGPHFPSTGASGCDLYALDESSTPSVWKFVGSFADLNSNAIQFGTMATNLPTNRSTAYRLYLPTYNSVVAGSVGVPQGCALGKDPRPSFQKPAVVWYGTSILQGGVASRVGNAFTNMISRRLKQEIFNFGFSGNGLMELGVYEHLAKIDAALIIIDCNWNMNGPGIATAAPPLIKYFRANGHPTTPIVLAEGTPAGGEWLLPAVHQTMEAKRSALRGAYEAAKPDKNLYYVNASQLWPTLMFDSPTVAGCHPTDEGGERVAEFYTKMIPRWIAAGKV